MGNELLENSENQGRMFDGSGGAPMDNLTGQQSTNDVDCKKVVKKNISSKKMQENHEDIETFVVNSYKIIGHNNRRQVITE